MSGRKINLEEIIDSQNIGEFKIKDYVSEDGYIHKAYKNAMLEFGKQLLELAAENAKIIEIYNAEENGFNDAWQKIISKQSILDTIKQVE